MLQDPRPPHRRYPLTSYVPFAIMVAIPVLLVALAIILISHFVAHSAPPVPSTPTAIAATSTPRATAAAAQGGVSARTVTPGAAPISTTLGATPTVTSAATIVPAVATIVIATHSSAAGAPVGAATVFHGGPVMLWCFATLPRVAAGDTLRYAWRDLTRRTRVVDWFKRITAAAAPYHARMFAYVGSTPATPFPPGSYRVHIYRGSVLAASGTFRVAPS